MLQGMLISSTLIPLCMFYCCIYLFLISMSSYDIIDQIELQYYLSTNIELNIKHSYYILRMIIGISRIFDFRTLRVGVPTALKWDGFSTSAFTIDIRRKTSIRTIAFCEGKRCVLDVFIIVYCGKVKKSISTRNYGCSAILSEKHSCALLFYISVLGNYFLTRVNFVCTRFLLGFIILCMQSELGFVLFADFRYLFGIQFFLELPGLGDLLLFTLVWWNECNCFLHLSRKINDVMHLFGRWMWHML